MEAPVKRDDPGKQPLYPSKQGMTEKPGLDIRSHIFITYVAAAVSNHHNFKDADEIFQTCEQVTEKTLEKLFPSKEGPKVQIGQTEEKGVCAHDGEIIMVQNTFQCMKCKNAVPTEVVTRRMKKS